MFLFCVLPIPSRTTCVGWYSINNRLPPPSTVLQRGHEKEETSRHDARFDEKKAPCALHILHSVVFSLEKKVLVAEDQGVLL